MNAAPDNITVLPAGPQPVTAVPVPDQPQDPKNDHGHNPRRTGKIAQLPKQQRDLINHWLDDGDTYETVCAQCAPLGISLNVANVHAWFHGGFQDFLKARDQRDRLRQTQDRLLDLARNGDAPNLCFVGLQVAVTQLGEQLCQIDTGAHKATFEKDANIYLRMLNSFARISKSMLAFKQDQDETARTAAVQLEQKDPDRDLSDKEYNLLVQRMDRVFRMPRPKPQNQNPNPPPANAHHSAASASTPTADVPAPTAAVQSAILAQPPPQPESAAPPKSESRRLKSPELPPVQPLPPPANAPAPIPNPQPQPPDEMPNACVCSDN